MNIILIIFDTLRKDHVGAYGNEWIVTPHLDSFARESVVFTRAYPESLPTLPFRRSLHTGMRTFPFHGHKDYKGDLIGAPGWGPIPEEQDTIAEILRRYNYRTGLISDCYHLFKPSKNFHRGFDEWKWIRGQEHDRYRSGPRVSKERVGRHLNCPADQNPSLASFLEIYLTNNTYRINELDYFPAQLFMEASRWIWNNQDVKDFFLVIDSFDPHEPWDPPIYYRKLYDPDDDCVDIIQSPYAPWKSHFSFRELKRLKANYAGEVTMVDRWFGFFWETLRFSGRLDDTIVAIISDHGHNLGMDPGDKGLVSKQGYPMTHAVADLVLMIRHPKKEMAGIICNQFVYNHDLTTTLLSIAGIEPEQKMDGINFWSSIKDKTRKKREHVTVAWGPIVTVISDLWWYNATIWGGHPILNNIEKDPDLEKNLSSEYPNICESVKNLAVQDAGGSIPKAFQKYKDRPGCTPFLETNQDVMKIVMSST